jgi:hypothetical protein
LEEERIASIFTIRQEETIKLLLEDDILHSILRTKIQQGRLKTNPYRVKSDLYLEAAGSKFDRNDGDNPRVHGVKS